MSTSTILPVIHPVEGNLHPESLAHLHTAIVDAVQSIDRMSERADASLAAVLASFRDMHQRHDRELANEMASGGHPPGEEGGFHHMLQGGVQRLRDLFQGQGTDNQLHHLMDMERHVIEAYNSALEYGGPSDTMGLLQHQREELGALVVRHDSRLAG